MKNWIFSLSLISSLALADTEPQCMMEHFDKTPPKAFTSEEVDYFQPDGVFTGHLMVKAMKLTGFAGTDLAKLKKAFEILEKVVNSEEFKDRILNFKNTKGERSFASNQGLANEAIYEQFMDGRETLQPSTVGEMNFFLNLYYSRWSSVIGYTIPSSSLINVNWKFFRNYKANEVARNLAHEWVHKLGFGHKSAAEHDSVPYAIGYIVEELGAKYLTTSPIQKVSRR